MKTSTKLIAIYLSVGTLWILGSDRLLDYLNLNDDSQFFQTCKGLAFIVISGAIFWKMLKAYERKNEKYFDRLKKISQQLQHSNDKYKVITKITSNVIWEHDYATKEVIWGHQLTEMFGYQQLNQPTNWWVEKIHPEDRERVLNDFKNFISKKEKLWVAEYKFLKEDGTIHYILDRGYALFDKNGNIIKVIGALQDITDRKLHEQQLQTLNEQLKIRNQELADTNAELEQFAYVASHDLQEPLRMVTRFLSEIERKYSDKLDEKGKEYIFYAVDGAKRMRVLILDLLEYSRIGRMEYKIETFPVEEILQDIILLQSINNNSAAITWDKMPIVTQSKTQLIQVFQNLISNALKYCKPEITCKIHISYIDLGHHHQFCVMDNGIGIHPDFFEKVFVIFRRLHGTHDYSGTGIGLAICKKIVETMGGKIWVKSQEGKGSQFYFTITK
ncbi:PAS domain-containing protein [Flavobacterium sp. NST-5]|uniref:histidine kinase n=1 Tax=Flavobacterium ichthyis TaxID=2698827 RepID=A0ABW9Z5L8_9FLAO|nr:PAS domain-containing sensor histidine kinase [Flavobacterium ichthyis]NBL64146.1 PAS domain-containing protein [Flavobacterium ichthyis]